MSAPLDRAAEALHGHVRTALATVAAGLPSSRAMRDLTGVTASCEASVLGEVTHGGPLTRQGLDVAVRRAMSAALDRDEIADLVGNHEKRVFPTGDGCWCGWKQPWPDREDKHLWENHVADAVIAHLLGSAA